MVWAFAKLGVPPDGALAAALAWRLADGAAAAMKPFELSRRRGRSPSCTRRDACRTSSRPPRL